ncbi:MAG TPA: hypothetical protein VHH36_07850 [Candidatus Thermoplasmatota archaeon]|nr:hypothetical protein [Candidatus Thermoplasmatota archaeon]
MMRSLLAAALLGALLAPTAFAQVQQPTTMTLKLEALEQPLNASGTQTLRGVVEWAGDTLSTRTRTSGVQVTLSVESLPAWAKASLNPSTVTMTFLPDAVETTAHGVATFEVTLATDRTDDAREVGEIAIAAVAEGSFLQQSAASRATALLPYGPAACHHPEEAQGGAAGAQLATQSVEPTAVRASAWTAVGAVAVAAALAGLAVRRALKR